MTAVRQIDRLPVDGFCPKFDRNLQIMCEDHIPNFIPVALIVFELSCSQTDIIPKLCFSDSGRSKTWRFVKISSSNFLTITILSLCILRIRESKEEPLSKATKYKIQKSGSFKKLTVELEGRLSQKKAHSKEGNVINTPERRANRDGSMSAGIGFLSTPSEIRERANKIRIRGETNGSRNEAELDPHLLEKRP
ncbi:hypothetical protein AVEN_239780-1 [Araneus ventricosus]|uniref:Uncharacterized protein n=1 Tax=Araneus ventricosus TaxID=182803 RepID=A0A4Y2EWV6_ARAVE|nr:hypothetical protein AVEN_239780-1 [Araneus ventricosus]